MATTTTRITLESGQQIIPDTLLSCEHKASAEASDHPVEDGSAASDNILRKPRSVSFTMLFSPGNLADNFVRPVEGDARPLQAYEALLGAMDRRERVYAMVDGRFYTPAAITDLSMPREYEDGTSRSMQVELKEVITAFARTVAKIAPKKSLKSKVGKKVKSVAPNRSDLAILAGASLATGNMGAALGYITGAVF